MRGLSALGDESIQLGSAQSAFAQLPSGRYLMTSAHGGYRSGLIVQAMVRCCDDPMLICVSARKGHAIDSFIRDSRSFAVGIMEPDDRMIARKFLHSSETPPNLSEPSEDDPFEGYQTKTLKTGSPILTRCKTWFDCEVMRRVDLESDTELFVGLVVGIIHDGEEIKLDQKRDLEEHR